MTGNIYISGQIGTFDGVTGISLIDVVSQVKKQPQATAPKSTASAAICG